MCHSSLSGRAFTVCCLRPHRKTSVKTLSSIQLILLPATRTWTPAVYVHTRLVITFQTCIQRNFFFPTKNLSKQKVMASLSISKIGHVLAEFSNHWHNLRSNLPFLCISRSKQEEVPLYYCMEMLVLKRKLLKETLISHLFLKRFLREQVFVQLLWNISLLGLP